jgi:3-hydroxymyristoyl/3-hydroxydecanoyl-(acyl carrier protein) dehydratase
MTTGFMDIKAIKEALPYRYPLLMVDRMQIESETKFVGLKNLCFNELYFQGHFPGHPILPGVLQVEAMKQVFQAGIKCVIDPSGEKDIYIAVMEKVKFRKPNNPGDRMIIEVEVQEAAEGCAIAKCSTKNNAGVTCQAILTLKTRDKSGPTGMPTSLYDEYDVNADIPMDVNKIMSYVPHRYPFLFIDSIIKIDPEDHRIIAIKNTTYSEEIYQGSDPDYPVLPGSIQAEIIAQSGAASVLSRPENEGKLAFFMTIDKAEYFAPIYPGDRIVIDINVPKPKGRFGKGIGEIAVDGEIKSRVSLMFAIVDDE